MNSMIIYKICFEDFGDRVLLNPQIPVHPAKNEDNKINRIPVCTTIPDCIRALELSSMITKDDPILTVYVYTAEVPMENIEHPNKHDVKVPDQWRTGELWIMHPWMFTKIGKASIRKHMEIPYSAYSRYAFTMENFDEVLDRICAAPIYGEMASFSFIDLDHERIEFVLKYYGENNIDLGV